MIDFAENFVCTLYELHKQGATGILGCSSLKRDASIYFIDGKILSIAPVKGFGDLGKYLQRNNILSQEELDIAYKWSAGKHSIERALVETGMIPSKKLYPLRTRYQQTILTSMMRWKNGSLLFTRVALQRGICLDNQLFSQQSSPQLLWLLTSKVFQTSNLLPTLLDKNQGGFVFPARCSEDIKAFNFPKNISRISSFEGQHISLQEITSTIVDTSGELLQGLWLLSTLGVLRRENDSFTPIHIEEANREEKISSEPPQTTLYKQEKVNKYIATVHRDYRRLMNTNYYAFLKLPEIAPIKEIEERCVNRRRMLKHLKKSIPNLDPETTQMIEDLLQAIELVWHHLGNKDRRREYDRKLQFGHAPLITAQGHEEKIDELLEVTALIEQKEYHKALLQLGTDETSARVCALRGWVKFKLKMRHAERELDKALALDSNNLNALEFMTKIAIEQQNNVKANRFVDKLLSIDPSNVWAVHAKAQLAEKSKESDR